MNTRKDYMDGKISHQDYYSQFVTTEIEKIVLRFGKKKLADSLAQDENLNNIPLHAWDRLGLEIDRSVFRKMKEAGDFDSLTGRVCILKAAARKVLGL